MSIAGCYSLHLYCDKEGVETVLDAGPGQHSYGEFPHEYTHELGSACRSMARRAGWKLDLRTGRAICPRCVKAESTVNKETKC